MQEVLNTDEENKKDRKKHRVVSIVEIKRNTFKCTKKFDNNCNNKTIHVLNIIIIFN